MDKAYQSQESEKIFRAVYGPHYFVLVAPNITLKAPAEVVRYELTRHGLTGEEIILQARRGENATSDSPLFFLRRDLEARTEAWFKNTGNPLADKIEFVNKEIQLYKTAIERAETLHANNHHSNDTPSVMQNEIVNFKAMLKVAEDYKAELLNATKKSNIKTKSLNFTQEERALMHAYNKLHIDDKSLVLTDYGYTTSNQVKKFLQFYNHYNRHPENRTRLEKKARNGAETKSLNKLKRILKVASALSTPEARRLARDEAATLKANIESQKY